MFTDINIYPINKKKQIMFRRNIFFYRKKSKTKVDIFTILGRFWNRIRNHIKMKRIRNTGITCRVSVQIPGQRHLSRSLS